MFLKILFRNFRDCFIIKLSMFILTQSTNSPLEIPNGEGGIWTLAPLLTTYSLSRGAPSASWVLLQMPETNVSSLLNYESPPSAIQTEKVGFEPTVPFSITGFQDQLLKPLGHLSICFHFVSLSQATHLYYHFYLHMSTTFFNFFYFFDLLFQQTKSGERDYL